MKLAPPQSGVQISVLVSHPPPGTQREVNAPMGLSLNYLPTSKLIPDNAPLSLTGLPHSTTTR